MFNINIDDGFKEFTINNDPDRVIRFNPTDIGIIERINKAYKVLEKAKDSLPAVDLDASGNATLESAAGVVGNFSNLIKEQVDYIFDYPVSSVVFGNQSPLSSVGGKPFYERFMMAAMPFIEKEVKKDEEASRKRTQKYIKQVK